MEPHLNNLTQTLLMVAVVYFAWAFIWKRRPELEDHRSLRVNRVNFLLFISVALFLLVLFSAAFWKHLPRLLLYGSIVFLASAMLLIIIKVKMSKMFKLALSLSIVGMTVFAFNYDLDLEKIRKSIDSFSLCLSVDVATCKVSQLDERRSRFFLSFYVFLSAFLIIFFYGKTYRAQHEHSLTQGDIATLDTGSLDQLIAALSIAVALIIALLAADVGLPTVSVVSGVIIAGITVAIRDLIGNFASGVLLLWDGSIKKNDVITIDGGGYGWVDRVSLRHTVIKDRNDVHTLIPNSILTSRALQNWTQDDSNVRLKLDIGIAYGSDLPNAQSCMARATSRADKRVLTDPAPKVLVISAGDSAINMQVRFWIRDPQEGIRNIMSAVYIEVLSELDANEIEVPFPKLDVSLDISGTAPIARTSQ